MINILIYSNQKVNELNILIRCFCLSVLWTFFWLNASLEKSTPSVKIFALFALNANSILSSFLWALLFDWFLSFLFKGCLESDTSDEQQLPMIQNFKQTTTTTTKQ